jgi:hypothetical protein
MKNLSIGFMILGYCGPILPWLFWIKSKKAGIPLINENAQLQSLWLSGHQNSFE